jgi:hypothetical protein
MIVNMIVIGKVITMASRHALPAYKALLHLLYAKTQVELDELTAGQDLYGRRSLLLQSISKPTDRLLLQSSSPRYDDYTTNHSPREDQFKYH